MPGALLSVVLIVSFSRCASRRKRLGSLPEKQKTGAVLVLPLAGCFRSSRHRLLIELAFTNSQVTWLRLTLCPNPWSLLHFSAGPLLFDLWSAEMGMNFGLEPHRQRAPREPQERLVDSTFFLILQKLCRTAQLSQHIHLPFHYLSWKCH